MCELEHHRSHKKEVHLFKKVGSLWVVALYMHAHIYDTVLCTINNIMLVLEMLLPLIPPNNE